MKMEQNPKFDQAFADVHATFRQDQIDLMLGRSGLQPCESLNSSSRKIMHSNQKKQAKCPKESEVPLVGTGVENRYGHMSSAFIRADDAQEVIAKISRYSMYPDHEYYLIFKNERNELNMVTRTVCQHNTETFGFLWNNDYLDSLNEGDIIPKGKVYKKSTSFDEFDNYKAGVNALATYASLPQTTEDPVIIREGFRDKLSSPELKLITVKLNDNDVLLNLYGDDTVYKAFPDLGEETKNGILCSIRKANSDNSAFTLSRESLRNITISDETVVPKEGKVVDIKVYSNKQIAPGCEEGELYNVFEGQLKAYNDEENRFARQFVDAMTNYINNKDYKISYELEEMYYTCKSRLEGKQFIEDGKISSNMVIQFLVYCDHVISIGDKLANRNGGKGVIADIWPDWKMPKLPDGTPLDIIWDESTCVNRLNIAQLSELSLNRIGRGILNFIDSKCLNTVEIFDILEQYYRELSPELADFLKTAIDNFDTDQEAILFIESMLHPNEGPRGIYTSILPISECVDFDKVRNIYNKFSYIKQEHLLVSIPNSDGTYRNVWSSKPSTVGEQFIYILKQEAEEKHSATSASSTNIKDENSKSKESKEYRCAITKTPVKWGEMETMIFLHCSSETVVINAMLMSLSPRARRSVMDMLLGDPYHVDIHIDMDARNRSAEKVQAIMKGMGLRLKFKKIPIVTKSVFEIEDQKMLFEIMPQKMLFEQVPQKMLFEQVPQKMLFEPIKQELLFKPLWE